MGNARYIGRVGALAVALGIGTAVANTPGVAWAEPDSSASAGSSSGAAGANGGADPAGGAPGDVSSTKSDEKADKKSDHSPDPTRGTEVSSSGGAHTSSTDEGESETVSDDDDGVGKAGATRAGDGTVQAEESRVGSARRGSSHTGRVVESRSPQRVSDSVGNLRQYGGAPARPGGDAKKAPSPGPAAPSVAEVSQMSEVGRLVKPVAAPAIAPASADRTGSVEKQAVSASISEPPPPTASRAVSEVLSWVGRTRRWVTVCPPRWSRRLP